MSKTAIITGVTGQDGSYLAELLQEKDYRVIGLTDNADPKKKKNVEHLEIEMYYADVRDSKEIEEAVKIYQPDEYYNLAAHSFVGDSWTAIKKVFDTNLYGCLNALEAIKNFKPDCAFYQASTSEMFGKVQEVPQNEKTPFYPRSPYGIAKLAAHWAVINYRESYGIFACSGILFNHESERRGEQFVTRKITKAAARIEKGLQDKVELGNIKAKRDWGYAPDYVEAMWLMLQQDEADDYVIATGEQHSVEEFCQIVFEEYKKDHNEYIEINKKFYRPAEVKTLLGDATKAKKELGWAPKTSFKKMVKKMVKNDLKNI